LEKPQLFLKTPKQFPSPRRIALMSYLSYLREYIFPNGCGVCGNILTNQNDARFGLCISCREFFSTAMAEERRCEICGRPLITEKETCLSCRESDISGKKHCNDHIIKMRALFPYTGKFKTALGSYKFGKALGPGYFFAQCLNSALADFDFKALDKAAWVPVPPRPGKIKAQGWDQIEYLARLLERTRELPACRCLKRLP
jgi:predicted amidophosphoribosyltransferase